MSKKVLLVLHVTVLFMLVLAACAPKTLSTATSAPQATEPPAQVQPTDTQAAATEPPVLVTITPTESVQAQPSPTLVTIDLSGPPMEVGSTYTYVDGSIIVAVPKGEFTMGHGGDDDPVHKVTVDDFWIYRTEVSNREYALCVTLNLCNSPDPKMNSYFDPKVNPGFHDPTHANDPVVGIIWDQADAYCKMVKGRLPTEAEWEKTARGTDGNIYPWGNGNPSCDLANIGNCKTGATQVTDYPQGQSFYGALNMAGNVFEWVADWYSPTYYSSSPAENPAGPETGTYRSVRSASFNQAFYLAESARRFRFKPVEARNDLGFRCVVQDPQAFAPWCQLVAYVGADGSAVPADVKVPQPNCPNVSGSSSGYCNTNVNPKQPAANLNFSPDPLPGGTLFTVPGGCSLDLTTADPNDYYCTGGGQATVQGLCTVPPAPVSATCPMGYTQNGNTCEWTGGGTNSTLCVPGATYDPATQCCAAAPGTGDIPLCPANAPYYSGGQCVPWPSSDYGPLVTINVNTGSCGTGGGTNNNGGGCNLTPNSCGGTTPVFCQSSCSCISRTDKCP